MCNLSQVATEAQSFRVVNQVLIKSSICLIWWALLLIKSNTELLDGGKPLNLVISEIFLGQFSPKTSNLYIKNTYFAKKINSDTISWSQELLKHFGQSQGGLPPPTQLTNTKIQMSQTSRLSRAINYWMWQRGSFLVDQKSLNARNVLLLGQKGLNWISFPQVNNYVMRGSQRWSQPRATILSFDAKKFLAALPLILLLLPILKKLDSQMR